MASKPFFDRRRGTWVMKYKAEPAGPWLRAVLVKLDAGSWSPARPPRKPPPEALEKARHYQEIEYRARNGMAPRVARATPLADYLNAYVESHRISSAPESSRRLTRHVRRFLEFAEERGVATLQAVGRALCREYLESRTGAANRNTLTTEKGYLMGAWTRAVGDGILESSPWSGLDTPGREDEITVTFWSPEEIDRIVAACRTGWHQDYVLVLANTGLRASTALAMAWEWIDWGKGVIRIGQAPGVKTRYPTAMGTGAVEVLRRMAGDGPRSGLVFPHPTKGTRVSYETMRSAIAGAIARAGVQPGTLHDFRHSFGRNLALGGVPVTVIQSQLGHKTLTMTTRYVSTAEDQAAAFMANFSVGLNGAGRGRGETPPDGST
jgi:integrase